MRTLFSQQQQEKKTSSHVTRIRSATCNNFTHIQTGGAVTACLLQARKTVLFSFNIAILKGVSSFSSSFAYSVHTPATLDSAPSLQRGTFPKMRGRIESHVKCTFDITLKRKIIFERENTLHETGEPVNSTKEHNKPMQPF